MADDTKTINDVLTRLNVIESKLNAVHNMTQQQQLQIQQQKTLNQRQQRGFVRTPYLSRMPRPIG